jgi:hypothetical protein
VARTLRDCAQLAPKNALGARPPDLRPTVRPAFARPLTTVRRCDRPTHRVFRPDDPCAPGREEERGCSSTPHRKRQRVHAPSERQPRARRWQLQSPSSRENETTRHPHRTRAGFAVCCLCCVCEPRGFADRANQRRDGKKTCPDTAILQIRARPTFLHRGERGDEKLQAH